MDLKGEKLRDADFNQKFAAQKQKLSRSSKKKEDKEFSQKFAAQKQKLLIRGFL